MGAVCLCAEGCWLKWEQDGICVKTFSDVLFQMANKSLFQISNTLKTSVQSTHQYSGGGGPHIPIVAQYRPWDPLMG